MTLQPTLHAMNKASSRRSTLLLSVNNFHCLWLPHAEQHIALKKGWRLVFKLVGEELDRRHHFLKEPVILWKVCSEAQETQPWPQRFLSLETVKFTACSLCTVFDRKKTWDRFTYMPGCPRCKAVSVCLWSCSDSCRSCIHLQALASRCKMKPCCRIWCLLLCSSAA